MEDILNLPVQDPPCAEFSATHIKWVKVEGGRQGGDDIALIPFARVGDFVKGESSNAECPASFRVESRRKRPEGSISKPRVDGYLEYTLYVVSVVLCVGVHCSFNRFENGRLICCTNICVVVNSLYNTFKIRNSFQI